MDKNGTQAIGSCALGKYAIKLAHPSYF